ncbi:MAG TPA: hypothetical protein VEX86_07415 [Longimicrobium sp.]|nr:hypothetical protein [Longimicrobium sp.]
MQHLNLETLARLVDEPATHDEAAHVASCLVCRRELDEMRAQTRALGGLDDPEPAPDAWFALESALRAEGLIRDVPVRPAVRYAGRGWLRIAAGVALFLLGGAAGLYLRGGSQARLASGGQDPARGEPVVVRGPEARDGGRFASADEAGVPEIDLGGPMVVEPVEGVRLASSGGGAARVPRVRRAVPSAEVASAERQLAEAEAGYMAALQRYAAIADPQSGADAGTRMAALERMINTTRAALETAPDDPIVNGYHLAALRERDTLRRQIERTDPDWF